MQFGSSKERYRNQNNYQKIGQICKKARFFGTKHNCINNRNIKLENYAQNAQKDIPNKNALVHIRKIHSYRKISCWLKVQGSLGL
jgi:hypothetical protein